MKNTSQFEVRRLERLRRLELFDTTPEALFDAVVRLAATSCAAPLALVCLVDQERLWFKAQIGLPLQDCVVPRAGSFCELAIRGDALFEVGDASVDPRFAGRPTVQGEPHIRFYAGMPLRLDDDTCLGTLCVLDRQARALDATQRQMLADLALMLTESLRLREKALELARTERYAQLLRERSEMLDVLAHEVRQPLNNASAALQSAASALALAGEQVASVRVTRAQVVMSQVLASVDNTLAAGALLTGGEALARQPSDLAMLVCLANGDMAAADRTRVQLEVETGSVMAEVDTGLMRLALRNLLSNALKYSPAGSPVTVRIGDAGDAGHVCIDVGDAGPGIEPELVASLFERGRRGRLGIGKPGHGLGLYIVHRTMALHQGSVLLLANSARGATFRLVLPRRAAA